MIPECSKTEMETWNRGRSCRLQRFWQQLLSALQRKSEDGRVAELGLRHSTRNRTWGNTHRGFESRPFRQLCSMGRLDLKILSWYGLTWMK
jgi:hypothetical protein